MIAGDYADRVREAQFRVEAGHGTAADLRLLEVDRILWGAGMAAEDAAAPCGDPADTRTGGVR